MTEIKIQLTDLLAAFANNNNKQATSDDSHWEIGKDYLIRTVTMSQTGRLIKVTDKELVLENAAWIADLGKFSEQWEKQGEDAFNEVEMFPASRLVIVGRGALIDAVQLINGIPKKTK